MNNPSELAMTNDLSPWALAEKEAGIPTIDDFIYFDCQGKPARIRRQSDGSKWLYRLHPDKQWVTASEVTGRTVYEIWWNRRVLFPTEILSMGLLGGIRLLGTEVPT